MLSYQHTPLSRMDVWIDSVHEHTSIAINAVCIFSHALLSAMFTHVLTTNLIPQHQNTLGGVVECFWPVLGANVICVVIVVLAKAVWCLLLLGLWGGDYCVTFLVQCSLLLDGEISTNRDVQLWLYAGTQIIHGGMVQTMANSHQAYGGGGGLH